MAAFFIAYFILIFIFWLLLIVLIYPEQETKKIPLKNWPKVSVLLAVRNEEHNIQRCLQGLLNLDYPAEKLEILIGDDQSTDHTVKLVRDFQEKYQHISLFLIKDKLGMAGAKGNVIAHLAQQAKGEFFFITDADVVVPSGWIKAMLGEWNNEVAIVSGSAMMDGKTWLAKFQCIDWITAFGMIYTAVKTGIPVTAVGNNMMVLAEAYRETGGFESIPFSVTEDFDLHEAVLHLGWKTKNLLHSSILSKTLPIQGFGNLLQQRKRWMSGAMRLPWYLVTLLMLQAAFFPVLLIVFYLFPLYGFLLWLTKILLQNAFLLIVLNKTKVDRKLLYYSLPYELYSGTCSFLLLLYYFLPLSTQWKGRDYE